jgi:hypothetical protein
METKKSIEKWLLEHCTTATAQGCAEGTGLIRLHQKALGHRKNVTKAVAARGLSVFYADAKNIRDIWTGNKNGLTPVSGLNKAEKAFVSAVVQYDGKEYKPTSKMIAAEFGLEFKQEDRGYRFYSYSSRDPFSSEYSYGQYCLAFLHLLKQHYPGSKVSLLFPGGKEMPPFVLEILKPVIPPFDYKYDSFEPGQKDYIICREDRINDFAAVLRFAGGEKLKVKQYSFDITKAKLAKMVENIGIEEVCDKDGMFCSPKEAACGNDFKVAPLLFALSANIGLIDIDTAGNVTPGKNAVALLSNPPHIFAKKLFESYVSKNKIYETHYITYISIRDGEQWVDWEKCRAPIIELLKTCPAAQWVKFEDFERYAVIFHGNFFRKLLNCAVYIQGYNFGYRHYGSEYPDWDECDVQIIRLILSFLGVMGILDIAYAEKTPRFKNAEDDCCIGISGFRITRMGAWILGLADQYETVLSHAMQSEDGGLVVQPDHTVTISGLKSRVEHESFLSGFLTRLSSEDNASVYRIDFGSMVKAYNNDIEPREIEAYLKKASDRPLSENVIRSFAGWQAKIGRVKIRKVTILEADDALLLEELVHAGGMDKFLGDSVKHGVIISDDKNQARVKTIAEKNGWLVSMESAPAGRGK